MRLTRHSESYGLYEDYIPEEPATCSICFEALISRQIHAPVLSADREQDNYSTSSLSYSSSTFSSYSFLSFSFYIAHGFRQVLGINLRIARDKIKAAIRRLRRKKTKPTGISSNNAPQPLDDGPKLSSPCPQMFDLRPHSAVRIIRCGHVFGRNCARTWFRRNNTCPMCRIVLYSGMLVGYLFDDNAHGDGHARNGDHAHDDSPAQNDSRAHGNGPSQDNDHTQEEDQDVNADDALAFDTSLLNTHFWSRSVDIPQSWSTEPAALEVEEEDSDVVMTEDIAAIEDGMEYLYSTADYGTPEHPHQHIQRVHIAHRLHHALRREVVEARMLVTNRRRRGAVDLGRMGRDGENNLR